MTDTFAPEQQHNGQHAPAATTTTDPRARITWDERPDKQNPNAMDMDEYRIPFGDLPSQTIPASWAATMLTELCAHHRNVWARLVEYAMTGEYPTEQPKATRGRPKAAAE